MRGPRPDQSKIHQLAGGRAVSHRREKGMEPAKPLMDLRPPTRLKGIALETWKRIAQQLLDDQVLSELSLDLFVAYCDAVADYDNARRALEKRKSRVMKTQGAEQQVPEVGMSNRALELMLKLGEIFAIDSYTRERRGKKPPHKPNAGETGPSLLTHGRTG